LGDWIFSIISGDSERKCTGCTLSERPHERTEKDIPKVVSDGKINPAPFPKFWERITRIITTSKICADNNNLRKH
uniref:hypothetical protein n=1 Tax=Candidatus Fimenecus sp. TaxID=3022888 RepID=UPI004025E5E1